MQNSHHSVLEFVHESEASIANGGTTFPSMDMSDAHQNGMSVKRSGGQAGLDDDSDSENSEHVISMPKPGKKTKGRVKIKMEFIENKLRRYTTFSKRKTGIMKKVSNAQCMHAFVYKTLHIFGDGMHQIKKMVICILFMKGLLHCR